MKRLAVAAPLAILLVSLGCGDDEPSRVEDAGVTPADSAVTKNDASSQGDQKPLDSGLSLPDAQVSSDGGTQAPVDAGPDPIDAEVQFPPDAEIIVVEGDAGTDWILSQQCPPSAETDECAVCEDTHCCDSYARYLANTEARAFWQCVNNCTPTAGTSCEETCAAQHPTGTGDIAARTACYSHFCPAECNEVAPTTCSSCVASKCSSQFIALNGTESGFLLQACNRACNGGAACLEACSGKYSTGAGLLILLGECVKTNCATECPSN